MSLETLLVAARNRRNLTESELAEKIGNSQRNLSNWIRGQTRIKLDDFINIMFVLNFSVAFQYQKDGFKIVLEDLNWEETSDLNPNIVTYLKIENLNDH